MTYSKTSLLVAHGCTTKPDAAQEFHVPSCRYTNRYLHRIYRMQEILLLCISLSFFLQDAKSVN